VPADTRLLYTLVLAAVVAERVAELVVSRRHERALAARGAMEVGGGHYPFMVALHASLFPACLGEVWLARRPSIPALAAAAGLALIASMALRWWTIATLGERWTTRVLVLPGAPLVGGGPFRFLRHPNYLAVAVEIFAIALLHTAWATAALWGGANLALLAVRIRAEDRALRGGGGGIGDR
jgi:methyltransferase